MADDLQRLIVSLEARINQYERNMARAERNSDRRLGNIERRFQRANKNISTSLSRFVGPAAAGLVSAATLRSLTQLADANTRVQNALKVTGAEGEKLRQVYDGLFASAQRNAAPLESLVELYSRASLVQGELKVSTEELLKFTDNVALALRAQGGSAESARGALLQLSQALGSGIVRAEEFNSLLEGAPAITQAVAAGLEEAGGSVAKLRSLVVDGKVSSQAFFRAFEAGAQILEDRVASAELTVSQGFVRLQNVLIDTVGKLDDSTGASNKAGAALGRMATAVEGLGDFLARAADGPLGDFIAGIAEADRLAKSFLEKLAKISLNDEAFSAIGNFLAPAELSETDKLLQERIDLIEKLETMQLTPNAKKLGFADTLAAERDEVQRRIEEINSLVSSGPKTRPVVGPRNSSSAVPSPAAKPSTAVSPVSLDDYKVDPTGGAKGSRARADAYAREVEQLKARTDALNSETQILGRMGPLQTDYGFAIEKARAARELLTAAEQQGLEVTPQLQTQIDQLATGYANAHVEAQRLAEGQQSAQQMVQEFASSGQSALKGFISDLRSGTDGADALANALSRVGDRLLDLALNQGFSLLGGGLGGGVGRSGLLGGAIIPGILHSGGMAGRDGYGHGRAFSSSLWKNAPRYHGGTDGAGLKPDEVPAVLLRGERVIPRGGQASGASVSVQQYFTISGTVSDRDVQRMMQQNKGETIAAVKSALPSWQSRRQSDGALA